MADKKEKPSRNWRCVLYPEDPTHCEAINKLAEGGYRYACILHNQDIWKADDPKFDPEKHKEGETKKEHWHIVLNFQNARHRSAIAKELGITENRLETCSNLDGALLYLVHYGYEDKHQYDHTEVVGTLAPRLAKLLAEDTEDERVLQIVKYIDDHPGYITYREALIKACQNGLYGEFRRLGSGAKYLLDEHNSQLKADYFEKEREALYRRGIDRDKEGFVDNLGRTDNWVARREYREKNGGQIDPL